MQRAMRATQCNEFPPLTHSPTHRSIIHSFIHSLTHSYQINHTTTPPHHHTIPHTQTKSVSARCIAARRRHHITSWISIYVVVTQLVAVVAIAEAALMLGLQEWCKGLSLGNYIFPTHPPYHIYQPTTSKTHTAPMWHILHPTGP